MKTKILIILALITCQITIAAARSNSPKGVDGPARSEWIAPLSRLAPVTPVEATFDDAMDVNPVTLIHSSLAPVTPKEATFDDIYSGKGSDVTISSPVNLKNRNASPPPCSVKYGCSL